jgi:hypothetical protein
MPAHIASHRFKLEPPPLHRLIEEAFEAAGLNYIQIVRRSAWGEPVVFPENSIVAGHGLGLCYPYTSNTPCRGTPDHYLLPTELYYIVGYYRNALEVTATSSVMDAYSVHPSPYLDYNLGADMLKTEGPEVYWEGVRRFLATTLTWRIPTKVILYGEFGSDQKMRETVQEALKIYLPNKPEFVEDGLNPMYVGAFGAAEFAKRQPYWDGEWFVDLEPKPKKDL